MNKDLKTLLDILESPVPDDTKKLLEEQKYDRDKYIIVVCRTCGQEYLYNKETLDKFTLQKFKENHGIDCCPHCRDIMRLFGRY